MTKIKAILIATAFFPNYPSINKFHVTSDEQVFELEELAQAHASFLDKKNSLVITVERTECEQVEDKKSEEQTAVDELTAKVAKLEKAFGKAAVAKKPVIQKELDEVKALLADAEIALEASLSA